MPIPLRSTAVALIAASIPSVVQSISLSSFTPRTDNLPASCQSAYTSTIQGCQASDFGTNARCSSNCVQGLVQVMQLVSQQCNTGDVPSNSIIGVFLAGGGIPAVCPGVSVTTIAPASSQTPAAQISAPASSTVVASSSSSSSSTTSTLSTDSPSSTRGIIAATSSPSLIVAPTSSTEGSRETLATSRAPALPSKSANSQKSNQDSGGGSPFDVVATGTAQVQAGLRNFRVSSMLAVLVGMALAI